MPGVGAGRTGGTVVTPAGPMRPIAAATLVAGAAEGLALVLAEPLSFWGGLDPLSGRIIDRWHPACGQGLAGRILVMRAGRGSSSGSSVLAEAIRRGTGPAGIVLGARDGIVVVGALVARALYGKACPVVLAALADWRQIEAAPRLQLLAEADAAVIAVSAA